MNKTQDAWPTIPFDEGRETITTLQLWTQIVGKIRLALTPWVNHSWHVPLYVSARGLATGPIAYKARFFELEFDFVTQSLSIRVSNGDGRSISLHSRSVADFFAEVTATLKAVDIFVEINQYPNEVADPIRFSEDDKHRHYDAEYAHRLWLVLLQTDRVFRIFRTRFLGKNSPVHFFWGSFDLAVTRFSGRSAPRHPGGIPNLPDAVTREAYSHEVSSAGFWPGGGGINYPAYYSYAYPTPEGFADGKIQPKEGFYSEAMGEFVLPYDSVRSASRPDEALLQFLQSTYEVAANLGAWDREQLECETGQCRVPRVVD